MNGLQRELCAAGIDIGGTKMAVAIVNAQGAILARELLPTDAAQGFDSAVDRLSQALGRVQAQAGVRRIEGIGIGCAGPVDSRRGLINNPYTLSGWDKCDIVTPLCRRFDTKVYLENDADVAAVGECSFGAGKGADPVVMLTFGTGIGGGTVVGGEVFRGMMGEHPELGHIPVKPDGPPCYCGIGGCLESIASGTAIATAGKAVGLADARAVYAAAATRDVHAAAIIAAAVEGAATAAWTIFHTLLPQRLILGGGMMDEHFDLFATAMRAKLKGSTQFSVSEVEIVQATRGNDAGVIGAAALALQRARASTQ